MRDKLYDYVMLMHQNQVRKYGEGEPYIKHLERVAEKANMICGSYGYEIGLLHDIIEDTDVTYQDLINTLLKIGYDYNIAARITSCVQGLTNMFTHEAFPHIRRTRRKIMENARLATTCHTVKKVKMIDIIDNIKDIVEVDPKFARIYVPEKFQTVKTIAAKDREIKKSIIYPQVIDVLTEAENKLKKVSI